MVDRTGSSLPFRKQQPHCEPFEQVFHCSRTRLTSHQRGRKQALGNVHAELAIRLELLLVKELVKRALMRKVGMQRTISFDQLQLVSGDRKLEIKTEAELLTLIGFLRLCCRLTCTLVICWFSAELLICCFSILNLALADLRIMDAAHHDVGLAEPRAQVGLQSGEV